MSAHVHIYSIWVTMMAEFWRVNFPKWQSSMIQKWNTWRWCNGFQRSLQSNHSSSLPLPGFLGPNESWFFTLWGVLRPSSQSSQEAITRTRFFSFKQIHRWSRWSGCLIGMPGWCIMIIPIMWGSRRPKLLVNWSPKICQSAQTNRCRHSKSCRNLGTGKEHPPTKWPRALLYCNEKKTGQSAKFCPCNPKSSEISALFQFASIETEITPGTRPSLTGYKPIGSTTMLQHTSRLLTVLSSIID